MGPIKLYSNYSVGQVWLCIHLVQLSAGELLIQASREYHVVGSLKLRLLASSCLGG